MEITMKTKEEKGIDITHRPYIIGEETLTIKCIHCGVLHIPKSDGKCLECGKTQNISNVNHGPWPLITNQF